MDSTPNGTSDREAATVGSTSDKRVPSSAIDLSYVYRSLDNRRRRQVVATLAADRSATTVLELATRMRARERDTDGGNESAATDESGDATDGEGGPASVPDDLRISLVHTHLPKLDELGMVAYDRTTGRVEPTDRIDVAVAAMRGVAAALEDD
jgi:DNA-binding transcriptional ArsR family regulator